MTRDIIWRGAGLGMFGAACVSLFMVRFGLDGLNGLLCFILALAGAILMIHGKRVALVWRVERSRHRELATTIGAGRRRKATARRERE